MHIHQSLDRMRTVIRSHIRKLERTTSSHLNDLSDVCVFWELYFQCTHPIFSANVYKYSFSFNSNSSQWMTISVKRRSMATQLPYQQFHFQEMWFGIQHSITAFFMTSLSSLHSFNICTSSESRPSSICSSADSGKKKMMNLPYGFRYTFTSY